MKNWTNAQMREPGNVTFSDFDRLGRGHFRQPTGDVHRHVRKSRRRRSGRDEPGKYPKGTVGASAYCYDVVAEACSGLLSFVCSVAMVLRGYSYYDNGHRFAKR